MAEWSKLDREKKADEKFKVRKKKYKESDVNHQHDLTQVVFNKMRVLEEKLWFKLFGLEPECISCKKKNMDWCNGHFKSVGSQGALRYDPLNSYLQCNRYCNMALSGNINGNKTTRGYLVGLIERFGVIVADEIVIYCERDRVKVWSCDELEEMRKSFNVEIRGFNND
ncbi:recombination protein NinG [candidate division KSB1 bacterium]|nr:recombination protein NinG [candidate division KSB1 bacterium]